MLNHQNLAGLRAFIYLRNSKGKRGTSIRDQEVEDRRICDRNEWSVAGVFQDRGISASRYSKTERSDYEDMVLRMRAGECDVLVYWEASRGYRTLDDYLLLRNLCEKHKILLCYNGRAYDMADSQDRYTTGQDALKAENGADEIRERNLRTHRLAAERGAPVGIAPYGYRREYDPGTGELLGQVVHEGQAPIIVEIFQRVAAGKSIYSIRTDFNRRGVTAPGRALEWRDGHVTGIARNAAYIGKRVHQGEIVADGAWPSLVGDEVFYACAKVLSDPKRTRHEGAVAHLLTGIALCGKCDPMRVPLYSGRTPKKRGLYICMRCTGVAIGEDPFDDIVQDWLLEYVEREEFAESLRFSSQEDPAAAAARSRVDELEVQLADARKLATTIVGGRLGLSVASLAALEAQLLPMIEAAREQVQESAVPPVLLDLAGPGARDRWEGLDLHQRRAAIRATLSITLYPAGKGAQKIVPGRYRIEPVR